MATLIAELANNDKPAQTRQLAGLVCKNALDSKARRGTSGTLWGLRQNPFVRHSSEANSGNANWGRWADVGSPDQTAAKSTRNPRGAALRHIMFTHLW